MLVQQADTNLATAVAFAFSLTSIARRTSLMSRYVLSELALKQSNKTSSICTSVAPCKPITPQNAHTSVFM